MSTADTLITRYRPDGFDQVLGHAAVVASLQKAIDRKLSRCFIFTGPSGTGKTTLSRIVAGMLGCTEITEVDAATQTGIDDMRSVADGLMYKSLQGGNKGVIIDECQGLSKQAWNSLLKILEEPPKHVYWFLCTTEPTKVPKTISTRGQVYDLKPVPVPEIMDLLDLVAEEEKLDLGPEQKKIIELCALEAGGSPRQALSNLGVCSAATSRAEAAKLLRSAIESNEAIELARALSKGASWSEVQQILNGLGEANPEGVRHVVRAYMTKVVLGSKSEDAAGRGLEILDAFSQPCHSSDGLTPIVLACGRVCLS